MLCVCGLNDFVIRNDEVVLWLSPRGVYERRGERSEVCNRQKPIKLRSLREVVYWTWRVVRR